MRYKAHMIRTENVLRNEPLSSYKPMSKERKPIRQMGKISEQERIPPSQNKLKSCLAQRAFVGDTADCCPGRSQHSEQPVKMPLEIQVKHVQSSVSTWGVGPTEKPQFPFEVELTLSTEEREWQAKSWTTHGLSA